QPQNGIARLLQIAGRRRSYLFLSGFFAISHAAMALVPYILIYYIIQQLVQPPIDAAQLKQYLFWAFLGGGLSYVFLYISGMASHVAAFNILYELRKQTVVKLGQLPLGFVQNFQSGALKKIVADDIERIEGFLAHQIPDFVKGISLPVLTIVYLFFVDWRLAAISFIPLLVLAIWIPAIFSSEDTKKMMRKYHQAQEDMNGGIVEFVSAMPVMKIFGQTADNFHKYSNSVNEFTHFYKEWTRRSAPPFAVFMSFMSNASLPILLLGTYLYLNDGMTLSVLILFLILGVGYIKPLFALSNMGMQIMLINRGVQRMDAILRGPDEEEGKAKFPQHYDIEFDRVNFSYRDEIKVLDEVSFHLPEGSITAFVGPSGAGKSTAAQLLACFWKLREGSIRIGGVDIQTLSTATLLEQVSFVFQDSFMFQETIFENIRMGMERSKAQVIAAAKAAQCHQFILELPQGYQTYFGSRGVYLSGGEQQRIQLARAILKDAPILVLDEATAFSDPENEYLIQQAVGHLIQNKTVVIIAHRLSTITDANQIIVFENGKIVDAGQHLELLERAGLYAQMWNAHTRAKEFAI
ncbi:MAG: ABC transporter ATP-binding protein, partial [Bacteroidota bacterium]